MTTDGAFEVVMDEDEPCVVVRGELDAHTAAELDTVLRAHPDVHCLDLGEVGFLDSAGLRSLLTAHQRLADDGRALVVRRSSGVVRRLLRLAGVSHLFAAAGDQDPTPA